MFFEGNISILLNGKRVIVDLIKFCWRRVVEHWQQIDNIVVVDNESLENN